MTPLSSPKVHLVVIGLGILLLIHMATSHPPTTVAPVSPEPEAPISVQLAPASASPAGSAGGTGVLRIDAEHLDPMRSIPWVLGRGGRLLLTVEKRIVAEMTDRFEVIPANPINPHTTLRDVTLEVLRGTGKPLPRDAERAVLAWPEALWTELTTALQATPSTRHELLYEVHGQALEVRDRRNPNELIVRFN